MHHPTLEQVKTLVDRGNLAPIYREIMADTETPVSAYLKVARGPYSFLLESVEGGERVARYSFIGTEPSTVLRTGMKSSSTTSTNGVVNIDHEDIDPIGPIQNLLANYQPIHVDGLPRFRGGAVGYLAYDAVRHFEQLPTPPPDPNELPLALFMITDTFIVFDHSTQKLKIVTHIPLGDDIDEQYAMGTNRIDEIVNRLSQPMPAPSIQPPPKLSQGYQSNLTEHQHADMVKTAKRHITEGDIIQTVISQRLRRDTDAHPFDIYRALRTVNPSPYMFYLDLQNFQLVGASPEMLVQVDGNTVATNPIAGTRPRGNTEAEDLSLEQELLSDEKERAEHVMLVDLGRNDIGRVSKPNTVKVNQFLEVERFSHVMHLVSQVSGQLQDGVSCFDALRACFPAGTVSGAPKIRAMEIIAELEPHQRGPYAGAVGYFDFAGNMDTCIALRTMVLKDGVAYIQAGGGIVFDSDPHSEYMETLHKAAALLKAIDEAEGLEQRFGPVQNRPALGTK